jgi:type IV conjugative transfer system protein TraL
MQDHTILNYLDVPPRILLWPASEVCFVAGPFLALTLFGFWLWGIAISFINLGMVRFYKRSFGPGRLSGFLYWYLPQNRKAHPVTPPSYIRELVG